VRHLSEAWTARALLGRCHQQELGARLTINQQRRQHQASTIGGSGVLFGHQEQQFAVCRIQGAEQGRDDLPESLPSGLREARLARHVRDAQTIKDGHRPARFGVPEGIVT
jgi:hypothetical protein